MLIKQDYDYQELEKFIKKENLQLYYLIRNNNQQDNFVLMVERYVNEAPSIEELNDYMYNYKNRIEELLFLK